MPLANFHIKARPLRRAFSFPQAYSGPQVSQLLLQHPWASPIALFYSGETMTRSTCWSLFAVSVAIFSYLAHRDISANVFIGSFFIIQALKPADEARLNQSAMALCALVGTTIVGFAICAWAFGLEWGRPASW